jgi:hypothetical protein
MSDIHSRFSYPTEAQGNVPAFNSIEVEAEFWDTYDVFDFEPLNPNEPPANPNEYEFVLKLSPTEITQLIHLARARDVSPASLVESWVKERVQREALAQARCWCVGAWLLVRQLAGGVGDDVGEGWVGVDGVGDGGGRQAQAHRQR